MTTTTARTSTSASTTRTDLAAEHPPDEWPATLRPSWLLAFMLLEVLALTLLLLASLFGWAGIDRLPANIGDVLPIVVPWGGALGGVTIGLVSLVWHWTAFFRSTSATERRTWNAWYVAGAPLGAIYGSVGCLVAILFLHLVVTGDGTPDLSPTGSATLFVMAFAIGYRQAVFSQLISKVLAVLLGPGNQDGPQPEAPPAAAAPTVLVDEAIDFGRVAVDQTRSTPLTLRNNGQAPIKESDIGFRLTGGDNEFLLTGDLSDIPVGGKRSVWVEFRPTSAGTKNAIAIVKVAGTSLTVPLSGEGTAPGAER